MRKSRRFAGRLIKLPNLPRDAVERQEAILAAVVEKWEAIPDSGFVYPRQRYIEGEKVFEAEFCIENQSGEARVRYIQVELIDLYSSRGEGRSRLTHYLYRVKIVYQFEETRTDEGFGDNSATGFNAILAKGEQAFNTDSTLGFNEADNSAINTDGLATLSPADVTLIDDVLCHSKAYTLEVTAKSC
jgi:hypothetical protein